MRPGEKEALERAVRRSMPENLPLRGRFARAIVAGPLLPVLAELTALRARVAYLEERLPSLLRGVNHVP